MDKRDAVVRPAPLIDHIVARGRAQLDEQAPREVGGAEPDQRVRAILDQRLHRARRGANHGQGQGRPLRAVAAAVHFVHHLSAAHSADLPHEALLAAPDREHQRRPPMPRGGGVDRLPSLYHEAQCVKVPAQCCKVDRQQSLVKPLHTNPVKPKSISSNLWTIPQTGGSKLINFVGSDVEIPGPYVARCAQLQQARGCFRAAPGTSHV
mmetsp:Transcript_170235/g.545949  ORF Transcript_170235/g.545949 Transcript_170235/m.545949 type:complete len:208 (+) Transcript_170235:787-1410(+)